MSAPPSLLYVASNENKTADLGRIFARHIRAGDLILLQGTLGAGKSALARAIIRARLQGPDIEGTDIEVPSPTFLLVLPYSNEKTSILHADLYRLTAADEVEELGLFEDPAAIVIVEWPERAPYLFDQADLIVTLTIGKNNSERLIGITGRTGSKSFDELAGLPLFELNA